MWLRALSSAQRKLDGSIHPDSPGGPGPHAAPSNPGGGALGAVVAPVVEDPLVGRGQVADAHGDERLTGFAALARRIAAVRDDAGRRERGAALAWEAGFGGSALGSGTLAASVECRASGGPCCPAGRGRRSVGVAVVREPKRGGVTCRDRSRTRCDDDGDSKAAPRARGRVSSSPSPRRPRPCAALTAQVGGGVEGGTTVRGRRRAGPPLPGGRQLPGGEVGSPGSSSSSSSSPARAVPPFLSSG